MTRTNSIKNSVLTWRYNSFKLWIETNVAIYKYKQNTCNTYITDLLDFFIDVRILKLVLLCNLEIDLWLILKNKMPLISYHKYHKNILKWSWKIIKLMYLLYCGTWNYGTVVQSCPAVRADLTSFVHVKRVPSSHDSDWKLFKRPASLQSKKTSVRKTHWKPCELIWGIIWSSYKLLLTHCLIV